MSLQPVNIVGGERIKGRNESGKEEEKGAREGSVNLLKGGGFVDGVVQVLIKEEHQDADEINESEPEDSDWYGRVLDLSQRCKNRLQPDASEHTQENCNTGTKPSDLASRWKRSLRRTKPIDYEDYRSMIERTGLSNDMSSIYSLASYQIKLKPYGCQHCEFRCNRKSGLSEHLATEHDVKPFGCPLCVYRCSMNAHLQRHINNVHKKVKPYDCPHCGTSFSQKTVLARHVLAIHNKVKPHSCVHCGYRFSQKAHLINHVTAVHDKVKPYGCSHCDYRCSVREHLKRHVSAVHDQIKPFSCLLCGYRFSRNGHLVRHVKVAHGLVKA